ncbi:MAG TPA: HAD-IA family hydrolase [Vicinamibacterales bacterium]|nr:HAD-IA family hydrolase [Vicinamibacterales bacterium]
MSRIVRAVLFDLDDTLFDHQACARAALQAVHAAHACFNCLPFDEFERQHARFLEELHLAVLDGRLGIEAAGVAADEPLLQATAAAYRERYPMARRAIDGAATLLPHVRQRARVAIVSNNLLDEQQQKLRHCGLDAHIDALVVSEEVGVSKPHPKIFEVALDRVGVRADEAVMIGDSWSADIAGALAVGIRPIWFNRHRQARPDREAPVIELYALEPVEPVLAAVFGDAA